MKWPTAIEALIEEHFFLSASSYKLARRCLRRWAAKEICGIKEPSDPATEFGTRAHAIAERYLRDREVPDLDTPEGRLVLESIPYLPREGAARLLVEHPFAFSLEGAWFYGFIDCVDPATQMKLDHKFVGSLDFAEDPHSLLTDPAAILYTLAAPAWEVTTLRWVYNLKRKRRGQAWSNPVDTQITLDAARDYACRYLVPAWRLLNGITEIFNGIPPENALPLLTAVPCNGDDCLAFGRPCPLQCSRQGEHTLESIVSNNNNNFIEQKLAEIKAKADAARAPQKEAAPATDEIARPSNVSEADWEAMPPEIKRLVALGPGAQAKGVNPPEAEQGLVAATTEKGEGETKGEKSEKSEGEKPKRRATKKAETDPATAEALQAICAELGALRAEITEIRETLHTEGAATRETLGELTAALLGAAEILAGR